MDTELRNCKYCNGAFQALLKELKRGNAKYCSRVCARKARPKIEHEPNVQCDMCQKWIYKSSYRISQAKTGLLFCSRECKDLAQRLDGLEELHLPHYGTGSGISHYRVIAFRVHPKICVRCGWDKHPAGIVVHHIDRNRNNNVIENLEVLCANCHAIEHHGEDE